MARPKKWVEWKTNPIESIRDNQKLFRKYFTNYITRIYKTPKNSGLFNIWIKQGYIKQGDDKKIRHKRESKRGKEHSLEKITKQYRASLDFFFDLAEQEKLPLTKTEKYFLNETFEWKHIRNLLGKDDDFLNKFRNLLLEIASFSISGWEEEIKDWDATSKNHLGGKRKYYLEEKIFDSCQTEKQAKLYINKLKKNHPKDWINELISTLPYSLILKIFMLYLPFNIGKELLKEDIDTIKKIQAEELIPNKLMFSASNIKAPKTKIQKSRREILNLYKEYEKRELRL